jgi:selenide, water dikinase
MGPEALAQVLRPLATLTDLAPADLLVGLRAADDAAVYRLNDEQAVVATLDFFPPVVDDAATFGAVAAANALSDIYAMGGEPLFCLNLVAWPDDLDKALLSEILRGGGEKVRQAGAIVAGGHSVTDSEPKYGLVAIGLVHPQRIFTKGGARPGDVVLLTKALGTGVITTALKREQVRTEDLDAAVESMTQLNRDAARALRSVEVGLHACTDVTGFGLLGHAWEMASQSGCGMRFALADLPWLPGARQYAEAGTIPGGTDRNRQYLAPHISLGAEVTAADEALLFDPQTSGGLLAAVDPDAADRALEALREAGAGAYRIGVVIEGERLLVE